MHDAGTRLHVICERDVGLFSLVQQVVANIPWAVSEGRTPVVRFGPRTCYWTASGHRGRSTVWEYYFEPVVDGCPAGSIPGHVEEAIQRRPPSPFEVGYAVGATAFASSHFGDHPELRGKALAIPYKLDDPDQSLRARAKDVIDGFIRPRPYIRRAVDDFWAAHLAGREVIGVHVRGTDATSASEPRDFRQGSLVLDRYADAIGTLLEGRPDARVLVATDDQASLDFVSECFGDRVVAYDSIRHQGGEAAGQGPTGWIMPAYIAADPDRAARNGEDAVIEYLLLSRSDHLVHNGSSLARTVLLNAPRLAHTNTHGARRPA
jgi:hypothetical protein